MEQMIQQFIAALAAAQGGQPGGSLAPAMSGPVPQGVTAPTGPANLAGYDPIRQDMMEKTFAHDPATGDPVISVGMDPFRVHDMQDEERGMNMGTYYSDEDAIYADEKLPKRDYTDTVKHEFRHRGTEILNKDTGTLGDMQLDELVMLMNDTNQGIGDNQTYNMPAIEGIVDRVSSETQATPDQVIDMANNGAKNYNTAARIKMGGGAGYDHGMQSLFEAMGWGGRPARSVRP